jgi:chromate reductase, NAD(P)H dehydrogenase (quinone)
MKIIALSGSLRRDSYNTRLAGLLSEVAPEGVTVELATPRGIPLYDGDLEEREGIPEAVSVLRERIKAADGLILVTPEYNAGMPGVLKNTLDWLTRPGEEMKPTFGQRPTALAGATPGAWGTTMAQSGALINLRQLGVHLYPGYLRVSRAHESLSDEGVSDKLRDQAAKWLAGFTAFVGET